MKNRKTIILLLCAIAMLCVLNVVFMCATDKVAIVSGVTLLQPSDEVSSICLERKDSLPVRIAKSSTWRIVEPYSSDVDESAVMKLLDALWQTAIIDSISDSELLRLGRRRSDFDLDDAPLHVKVVCENHDVDFAFGSLTPAGDGVYVTKSGVGAVFVMPSNMLAAVDVPIDNFRRRSLFGVVPETISAFSLKRAADSVITFSRNGKGWNVNGGNASESMVRKFLFDVLSTQVVDFVWPTAVTNEAKTVSAALLSSYGLDPESALTVSFVGVDGSDDRICFGKTAGEGTVYALVQRGGAIVTVPAGLKEMAMQDVAKYTDARIFPFDASKVSAFTIAEGGISYSFSRSKIGGWNIETPVSAPADSERVDFVLNRILALSGADTATSGVSVSISGNDSPVIVSRIVVMGDLRVEDLRSKEILAIDPITVKRIVMTSSEKNVKPTSVVYSRDRRAWNVELSDSNQKVDESGIAMVFSAINPLQALRIERLKVSAADLALYGLESPRLTIAIDQDTEKSVRRNIMLGNPVDGGCYATVGSSDAVFVISSETAGKISSSIVRE